MAESFEGGKYKIVVTQENIFVYRVFGGKASSTGAFITTVPAGNRINAKIDAALLPEWKNSKEFEAIIKVPKANILKGGADQYLMPQNWPSDWVVKVNPLPSK